MQEKLPVSWPTCSERTIEVECTRKKLNSYIYFHDVLMFPVELWIYLADIVTEVSMAEILRETSSVFFPVE